MNSLRVLGVALGLAFCACGSDDGSKMVPDEGGGAGGEDQGQPGGGPEGGGSEGGAATSPAGGHPGELEAGSAGDDGNHAGEGGAASQPPPPGRDLYVSPTGSDEAPGTEGEPYLTIAHAASLAQASDRIHLLDGTFDATTQPSFATSTPISIPAGVTLMAEHPGEAVLVGDNAALSVALEFAGPGELQNVHFSAFQTAIRASTGNLSITGLHLQGFSSLASSPLQLTGTAAVTLTPGAVETYASDGYYFASLKDSAKLLVEGGVFEGLSGSANVRGLFTISDNAELTLSNVNVLDTAGEVIFATDAGKVNLLEGTTIEGTLTPALANIELQGQSELIMKDTTLADAYWAHISTLGANKLEITDCTLTNAGSWALIVNAEGVTGTVSVRIDKSVISNSQSTLGQIDVRRAADFVITDSEIIDGAPSGIFFGDVPTSLVLRGTTITGNGQSALRLGGDTGSSYDLGRVDEPGGNTLRGNGTSQPALLSYVPAGKTVLAVGNTWSPNVQGANGTGRYAASAGAGAKLEVVGLENSGLNYWVMPTGSVLRLAENP